MSSPTPPPTVDELAGDQPQQLALLAESERPVQFRLSRHTRELGLAHIARIRRQLAERHTAA